jgi:hypothetical protein
MDNLLPISDSPFVGPTPFEESDSDRFFGRQREIEELLSLIIAHRAVLVYAQSGAGKTSLLRAGVIPVLKHRSFNVLPPARVEGLIPMGITPDQIKNIFAFHALRAWTETRDTLVRCELAAFLKTVVPSISSDDELPPPTVIILDQFEEFFTCNAERWKEREPFFRQLTEGLTTIPSLKIVLLIREEFLAQIEPFAELFPQRLRSRIHLERLRERPALAAITCPLKTRGLQFEPGVAEELVKDLAKIRVVNDPNGSEVSGELVEPVHLQVVCQSIWRNLPEELKNASTTHAETFRQITQAYVDKFGDVNDALARYYERAIKSASAQVGIHEGQLRRWIEDSLITPSGTRGMALGDTANSAGVPQKALEILDRAHVIHREERDGTTWYELTHDRFLEAIQESNRKWIKGFGRAEEDRKSLEEKATIFINTGELLDESDLRGAEKFIETAEAKALGLSPRVDQLILRSRKAIEEREQQRLAELERANREAELERQLRRREEQQRLAELERANREAELERQLRRREEQQRLAELERANSEAELERQLRRRDRRNARLIILSITCVALLVAYFLFQANQSLREQHKISKARFHRALRDLKLPGPTHDAVALHDLAIALRYNPGNEEAAKKTCELLMRNNWCAPITAPLHYPGAAILGATFGPDGNIFSVSGDGKLLRCDQDSSGKLEVIDTLFKAVESNDQRAVIPPAAFFSENGTFLLVILPRVVALTQATGIPRPGGPNESINPAQNTSHTSTEARILKWDSEKHTYASSQPEIQLQGTGPLYFVSWSSDARTLALITYQDNMPTCQVFQLGSSGKEFALNGTLSKTLTDANITAIAFSFNSTNEIATISLRNQLQLYGPRFELILNPPKGDQLKTLPHAAQLAFGPKEGEIMITTWGGGIWKLDIHTGNVVPLRPKAFYDYHDQLARVAMSNGGATHLLVATCLYSRITIADAGMNELSEPIPISEPWVMLARFRQDGDELLTLSGSIWNASDTIRVTSLKMVNSSTITKTQFDGKSPPSWLAEIADAVSGQQPDDEKSFWTLQKLYSKFAKENRAQEYDVIWQRFFPNWDERK